MLGSNEAIHGLLTIQKLIAEALSIADEHAEHVLGAKLDECLCRVDRRIQECRGAAIL